MTMEENPARSRHKKMNHKTHPPRSLSFTSQSSSSTSLSSTQSSSRNQGRFSRSAGTDEEEGTGGCSINGVKCTGQSCRACSAALVADCVALCCCPLAAISLIGLAFIKVPYAMGKRCLGRKKRREKGKKDGALERSKDIVFEFGEDGVVEQRRKSLCTGFIELDNVLLDLYQGGHLGFGRVSFTGIQPNAKSN